MSTAPGSAPAMTEETARRALLLVRMVALLACVCDYALDELDNATRLIGSRLFPLALGCFSPSFIALVEDFAVGGFRQHRVEETASEKRFAGGRDVLQKTLVFQ